MPRYRITYTVETVLVGSIEIDGDTEEQAQEKFEQTELGDLENKSNNEIDSYYSTIRKIEEVQLDERSK